jgi:hypothetical protein
VNEDDGCGFRGVGAVDLRRFVVSNGRRGGRDGHLLLLASRDSQDLSGAIVLAKAGKHVVM